MSRIVLTTIGSLGDLHPKIAIALELQKGGHRVLSKPCKCSLLNLPERSIFQLPPGVMETE